MIESANYNNSESVVPGEQTTSKRSASQVPDDPSKVAENKMTRFYSNNDTTSERPVFIMSTRPETFMSSSTLTGSEMSASVSTEVTDCSSSIWSYSDPKPPKLINVAVESTSLPYAQLCFDPESKTLVTLMEINLGGIGRRSKRLRIVDPKEHYDEEPPAPKGADTTPTAYSTTSGTVSADSRSEYHFEESTYSDPIVLSCFGQGTWLEETDLDLYLLHDCGDPWDMTENRKGCSEALKKVMSASRSLIVFRQRDSTRWETTQREQFTGIGYTMLD
jgi:hypothetical protein